MNRGRLWRVRLTWLFVGYLAGVAATVANAVRLGYVPW